MWFADDVTFVHLFRSWKDRYANKSLIVIDEGGENTLTVRCAICTVPVSRLVLTKVSLDVSFKLGGVPWACTAAALQAQGPRESKDAIDPILTCTVPQTKYKPRKAMEENLLLVKAQI